MPASHVFTFRKESVITSKYFAVLSGEIYFFETTLKYAYTENARIPSHICAGQHNFCAQGVPPLSHYVTFCGHPPSFNLT